MHTYNLPWKLRLPIQTRNGGDENDDARRKKGDDDGEHSFLIRRDPAARTRRREVELKAKSLPYAVVRRHLSRSRLGANGHVD
jgi:hypothetical protein